jgi:hypothetical protein
VSSKDEAVRVLREVTEILIKGGEKESFVKELLLMALGAKKHPLDAAKIWVATHKVDNQKGRDTWDAYISGKSESEIIAAMGVSPSISAAYDILVDNGVPSDSAALMAAVAQENGKDPEAFARHFVKLAAVARRS